MKIITKIPLINLNNEVLNCGFIFNKKHYIIYDNYLKIFDLNGELSGKIYLFEKYISVTIKNNKLFALKQFQSNIYITNIFFQEIDLVKTSSKKIFNSIFYDKKEDLLYISNGKGIYLIKDDGNKISNCLPKTFYEKNSLDIWKQKINLDKEKYFTLSSYSIITTFAKKNNIYYIALLKNNFSYLIIWNNSKSTMKEIPIGKDIKIKSLILYYYKVFLVLTKYQKYDYLYVLEKIK